MSGKESPVYDRWHREHYEESGDYASFVGFEADIRKSPAGLVYEKLNPWERVDLFGLVCQLLDEAAGIEGGGE